MAEKKQDSQTFVTPKGIASYPWLNNPDTKFKAEGEYSVSLIIPGDQCQQMRDSIDFMMDESYEAAVAEAKASTDPKKRRTATTIKRAESPPYHPVYDEDTDQETGEFSFRFKTSAGGVDKKTGKPWVRNLAVFDSHRKPIDLDEVKIYAGSILKVAYTASKYYTVQAGAGVCLYLNAVQVIELSKGNKGGAGFGFTDEDGYEADNTAEVFETTTPEEAEEAEDASNEVREGEGEF